VSDFHRATSAKKSKNKFECIVCGRKIPPGNPWWGGIGKWCGDWYAWKSCAACHEQILPNLEFDDGVGGDEFNLFIEDISFNCPNCKEPGSTDWEWSGDMKSIEFTCDNCQHRWVFDYTWEVKNGPV